ncbi:MAG: Molybdopterin-guanine dinucleotide biosynthesis protein MobA [Polyangiaceae bacterium]|jgi:molybdopterin-guanine dinucleotide biosynthesis protein A|nr:Molybdopterin-guanine dinucleotide biosynthesis protein MobA [Polyangiaceae bacterium]
MGGVAKGALKAPGSEQTLLERLIGEVRAALGSNIPLVLVGDATAYSSSRLPVIADDPAGIGPLGGLSGFLRHAHETGASHAIALACDLPRIEAALLLRLSREEPAAEALVAELRGVRNPLIARYEVARAQPAVNGVMETGRRALQAVLDALDARLLSLTPEEEQSLVDWDTPEDVAG